MKKIIICSGAGLSQESGIQTFRDSGGLWHNFSVDEICTLSNFMPNYIKVNDFYNDRRKQLKKVLPNFAHEKIAQLQYDFEVINYTTNVDDLLERSGSENVVHLHGLLTEVIVRYGKEDSEIQNIGYENSKYDDLNLYPLKPNVVFFGESANLYEKFFSDFKNYSENDIMVVIGSSEQVFQYCYNAKYLCDFKGKIIFVNKDLDLCEQYKMNGVVDEIYCMSACQFFKFFNFDQFL